MTNKAEDKFYFGKHGQPERFSSWENLPTDALKGEAERLSKYFYYSKNRGEATSSIRYDISNIQKELTKRGMPSKVLTKILQTDPLISYRKYFSFSRPGQPERFAESLQAKWDGKQYRVLTPNGAAWYSDDGKSWTLKHGEPVPASELRKYDIKVGTGFSRPGQPEKFDASSLDRGSFAEASQSPMLGKLLAAKVMPEGGWRAVQVGSDTLVISFEDADLARDFGRRAATKGYNATSPMQAIGRYWNVEVKNGK